MTKNEFWSLIDAVNAKVAHIDQAALYRKTKQALLQLSQEDILDWHLIKDKYISAAYRNDLWAASAALGAHYTDDGFIDFRHWLLSFGRQVFIDALRDPDSLALLNTEGEYLNFERYGYVANEAFDSLIFKNQKGKDSIIRWPSALYTRLESYQLDPETVAEINAELPQRPDIDDKWTPQTLITLVPRICVKHGLLKNEQKTTQDKIKEMLGSGNVVHAYATVDGSRTEYMFEKTPENIAWFVGGHPTGENVLTDCMDCLVLSTFGHFVNQCPDKALLAEVLKTLLPIQRGAAEVMPFFCPTVLEVEACFKGD